MAVIDPSIIHVDNNSVVWGKATTKIAAEVKILERLSKWQPLTDAVMKCNKGSVKL